MLTVEDIIRQYANVFRPECGKPLGTPMHIELDPSVTPVHATTRRVPVAKSYRVNEELKRLCEKGIITPVTQPTDWQSNQSGISLNLRTGPTRHVTLFNQ